MMEGPIMAVITTIWVDAHGNVLFEHEPPPAERFHWTEMREIESAPTDARARRRLNDAPWPALVALAGIKCALINSNVIKIDTLHRSRWRGEVGIGFWDVRSTAWLEELLPAGLADRVPADGDEERLGAEGEDVAWEIYQRALGRASDRLRE
jgi:hypothetical protein